VAEVFSTLHARPAPALRLFPRLHLLALLLFLLYLLSFPLGFSYLAFACWFAHAPRVPHALRLACLACPAPRAAHLVFCLQTPHPPGRGVEGDTHWRERHTQWSERHTHWRERHTHWCERHTHWRERHAPRQVQRPRGSHASLLRALPAPAPRARAALHRHNRNALLDLGVVSD
jgi:hypothetical protein